MRRLPGIPAILICFLLSTAAFGIFSTCNDTGETAISNIAPDTILINGKIITVDPNDTIIEAVAVKDGRIIATGTTAEIRRLAGSSTRIIDLNGLTATPGLIDSHCHFSGTTMLYDLDLSYPAVKSIADVQEKVRKAAEALEPGEWIRGRGWDEGKLEELRYINAADLDAAAPDNPVWLTHTMGHYGAANSLALKMANVNAGTPDPPGGTIDKHPDGTPTGVLKESAQSLVRRLIPSYTREQEQKGLEKIIREFNKEGMTAVKDPGVSAGKWRLYQNIQAADNLTVRVFCLWSTGKTIESARQLIDRVGPFTRPYISTGNDLLIPGGVKLYLDGSGGARTAWLYDEWNKDFTGTDSDNYGYPVIDPELYRRQVLMFHDAGLHVSTHAIGDRAVDWVVDTYALALRSNPAKRLRHGIIHCNIPTDRAIETMAALQREYDAGYPESQSTFTWWIGDTYAGNFGPARSPRLMPFKTYQQKGVVWGGGSDFYVTPFAARYGIWASVARKTLRGIYGETPFGTDESVDVRTALKSYTIWNARLLFLEDKTGSIETGKYADIAVWDKDIYSIPTDEIKDMTCMLTLLGGDIVYQAENTPIRILNGTGR